MVTIARQQVLKSRRRRQLIGWCVASTTECAWSAWSWLVGSVRWLAAVARHHWPC